MASDPTERELGSTDSAFNLSAHVCTRVAAADKGSPLRKRTRDVFESDSVCLELHPVADSLKDDLLFVSFEPSRSERDGERFLSGDRGMDAVAHGPLSS